jgi:23S rRNA (guanosine2251-2'-O)-methyltransferase
VAHNSDKAQLIGGLHAVRAALKHGADEVLEVWVDASRKDARMREILDAARQARVKVQRVERQELDDRLGDIRHQGVGARVTAPAARDEKQLFGLLESLDEPAFLLILDGVTDPHNLGACLRSADAAGVQAVIAPKDRSAGLTPVAVKVASGAAESVPFFQVTNLVRTMQKLQQDLGIWMVGTSGEASQSLYETDLTGNLALVLGAEGKGMRRLTAEACDSLVSLPMLGTVESLNVSVAAGVCLFEALRQRRA